MPKLKLELGDLKVESFSTHNQEAPRGTVHGHFTNGAASGCYTCNGTCVWSCPQTCDNSLDYCTCQCPTPDCPQPTEYTNVCACDQG
jgi:hypothetical protein